MVRHHPHPPATEDTQRTQPIEASPWDVPPGAVPPEWAPPQWAPPRGMPPQGLPPQGVPPWGAPAWGMSSGWPHSSPAHHRHWLPWRRLRLPRWAVWTAVTAAVAVVFRKAIAALVLMALSGVLHGLGFDVHLPHVKFAWPWQTVTTGTTTNADLGPWVLQKIEGISRPALGQANFDFTFTHTVSKSLGPWPCWYASTFYAVGHAAATVDLNPGPAWWAPGLGHYRLQVLSRPRRGAPGQVSVTMVLPPPQLPSSAHDVTIDDIPSKPIGTQHSWTYPGLGCGVLLRPQFPESVLYAQAQQIAFYKALHSPYVTRPLVATAESEATKTIRDNFIQPTVNAFGYQLDNLTLTWTRR